MTAPATQHHGWRDRRSPIVDNGKLKTQHTSQFAHTVRSSLNACLDLLLLSALLVELMRQTFTLRGENSAVESQKNWRWQTLSRWATRTQVIYVTMLMAKKPILTHSATSL